MLQLKQLVTNLGSHPSTVGPGQVGGSIAGIEYPHGGHPPTTFDLEVNRDVQYHTWQNDQAAAKVCSTLGWLPELIGVRQAKSTLGGNLLYDMFAIKNTSTIKPRQIFFQDLWNNVLTQVCEREGGADEFKNYGISFPDVIDSMIESLKGSEQMSRDSNPAQIVNQTGEEDDDATNA